MILLKKKVMCSQTADANVKNVNVFFCYRFLMYFNIAQIYFTNVSIVLHTAYNFFLSNPMRDPWHIV